MSSPLSARPALPAVLLAAVAVGVTMTVMDLVFLGVVARPVYDAALGPLRATQVYWPAAALFYVMYVVAITLHAVKPAVGPRQAALRGAGMGFFAYATYELTNWAVLAGWPAMLVPVDIAWGTVLTAVSAAAGEQVHRALTRGR